MALFLVENMNRKPMISTQVAVAVFFTFASCSANVVFLEHLVKFSPRCGDLITFAQFLFISCYGFVVISKFGSVKPVVPVRRYLLAVVLFYSSTISGNLALGCKISMPLQMVFKSGGVLASLCLGVLVLKRSYTLSKYLAVILITVGISTCMLASTQHKKSLAEPQNTSDDQMIWFFGIFLLISSLFLGSALGVAQVMMHIQWPKSSKRITAMKSIFIEIESISLEFGKHPEELLFYSHVLALPGFLMFAPNIIEQAKQFSTSELYTIPYLSISIPTAWLYLGINVPTHLVVSIFYFNNPFTIYHWFGAILVFSGTLLFSGVVDALINKIRRPVVKQD